MKIIKSSYKIETEIDGLISKLDQHDKDKLANLLERRK